MGIFQSRTAPSRSQSWHARVLDPVYGPSTFSGGPSSNRHTLSRTPRPQTAAPPEGTERIFVPTVDGDIEVLVSRPQANETEKKAKGKETPLLLLHGGFGSALCWEKWFKVLREEGWTVYAISLRGHGHSHHPSYLSLLTTSPLRLASIDLSAVYSHIARTHSRAPALIAHSMGGGLAQLALSKNLLPSVPALVLAAAVPPWGAYGVYANWWFKADRWCLPRLYARDWAHPRSALGSTELVGRIFFRGLSVGGEEVKEVERNMPEYESMAWPMGLMLPYASVPSILDRISLCKQTGKRNVLVVGGSHDVIMPPPMMKQMAERYGCELKVANECGHHLLLDKEWEKAAREVQQWLAERLE